MKLLPSILILSFLLSPVYAQQTHTVTRVIDGDTLELENGERVRLIGIDTPESRPNDKAQRDAKRTGRDLETITQMGKEATEFVIGLVEGKEVRLEFDVGQRDKYGRLLAYVYLPENDLYAEPFEGLDYYLKWGESHVFVNSSIIGSGYASPMTIPPNVKYADLFKKLYQEARENKRGLWKDKVAPELQLKEEDFDYNSYLESLLWMSDILERYRFGEYMGDEIEHMGIPNHMLALKGYGLFKEKNEIKLELENAQLRGAEKKEINSLKKSLDEIKKQIEIFLSENSWID